MTRKAPAARTAVTAALLALSLVLVPTAVAGKGGGHGGGGTTTGTSTFKLVPLNPPADGLIHWGQQVTFEVRTTATSQPERRPHLHAE